MLGFLQELMYFLLLISIPCIYTAAIREYPCPRGYFQSDIDLDCYKCSQCPNDILENSKDCHQIWGLPKGISCPPDPDTLDDNSMEGLHTLRPDNGTLNKTDTVFNEPLEIGLLTLGVTVGLVIIALSGYEIHRWKTRKTQRMANEEREQMLKTDETVPGITKKGHAVVPEQGYQD